jgi:sugar phosphate isomerase/epimerase
MTPRSFAIAPITTPELAPPDLVAVAARTGYSHVGLRMLPGSAGAFAWPLFNNPGLLRETEARLRDTGVGVLDIDIIRLGADTRPDSYRSFLETGQRLGARAVLVVADDRDLKRVEANFAALCDMAAPCGLSIDIEFMPWTAIPDLAAAERLVRGVDRPNAGILIDTLHADRANVTLDEMREVDRRWLHYLQICDAPAEKPATTEDMIHCARRERLFPGDGGLDLIGMMRALPADVPVSVEVPTETLARTVGPEERARGILAATKRVLAAAG